MPLTLARTQSEGAWGLQQGQYVECGVTKGVNKRQQRGQKETPSLNSNVYNPVITRTGRRAWLSFWNITMDNITELRGGLI